MQRQFGALALLGLLAAALTGCSTALVVGLAIGLKSSSSRSSPVAAPEVSSVTPTSASHAGGESLTLRGQGFPTDPAFAPSVTIGGVAASDVVVQTPEQLTFTLPATTNTGVVDITVSNPPAGSGLLSGGFTLTNAAPTLAVSLASTTLSQNIVISVTVRDADADRVDLKLVVVAPNGDVEIPASQIVSGSTQGLLSSSAGVLHRLTWDSRVAFPTLDLSNVRLRLTPTDSTGESGPAAESALFTLNNNIPTTVELLQPGDDSFDVVLSFRVQDGNANQGLTLQALEVDLLVKNQTKTLSVKSGLAPGASLTTGQLHTTVWRSLSDLGFGNNQLVRVRVRVSDSGGAAFMAESQPFFVSNGPFEDQEIHSANGLRPDGFVVADVTSDSRPEVVTCSVGDLTATDDATFRGKVVILENSDFGLGNAVTHVAPVISGHPAAGAPATNTNAWLSSWPHPSECAALDSDGDGDRDLVAANSAHATYTSKDLVLFRGLFLTDAAADAPAYLNVRAHQVLLFAPQVNATKSVDVTNGNYETAQAPFGERAPATNPGPVVTNVDGTGQVGWVVMDLEAVDLDPPGAPGAGRVDLVTLHGFAQLGPAIADAGTTPATHPGCVVIRQFDGARLGNPFFLDFSRMGSTPSDCSVADLDSAAHVGGVPFTAPAGTPDIVVANTGDGSLTFFFQTTAATSPGNRVTGGAPTFQSAKLKLAGLPGIPAGVPVLNDVRAVTTGDLDGDSNQDLVVILDNSRLAVVLLHDRNPAATNSLLNLNRVGEVEPGVLPFRVAQVIPLPVSFVGRPRIQDVTGDGRPELIVPLQITHQLLVFENVSAAQFGLTQTPVSLVTQFQPYEVEIADMNGDGRQDAVVGCIFSRDTSVFLQATAGTLDKFVPIASGGDPFVLATGDLTGDGKKELVVSLPTPSSARVYRADPTSVLVPLAEIDLRTATLTSPANLSASVPVFPTIVDATGDGKPDLLVAMELTTTKGAWSLVPGGPLAATPSFMAEGSFPPIGFGVNAGDFLGNDGIPDVVLVSHSGAGLSGLDLYPGLGNGQFGAASQRTFPGVTPTPFPTRVEVVDYDLDGDLDLVVGDEAAKRVLIFTNTGGAIAAAPVEIPAETADSQSIDLRVVDVGGPLGPLGQALPDIVLSGFSTPTLGVMFQGPALGTFSAANKIKLPTGSKPSQVAIGDLNGDGLVDIAVPWQGDDRVAIYYRRANPVAIGQTFLPPVTLRTASAPTGSAILDVDGDGKLDLVVSARGANAILVYRQR
jgi:hypothetical protein